jgi:hypothetical protein
MIVAPMFAVPSPPAARAFYLWTFLCARLWRGRLWTGFRPRVGYRRCLLGGFRVKSRYSSTAGGRVGKEGLARDNAAYSVRHPLRSAVRP